MKSWYLVLLGAVISGLYGCGQGPDIPPAPVDLAVAAQVWNTPDKQWSEAGLHRLIAGERLYRKRCAGCHLSSGEGQLTLGAPALKNSAIAKGPAGELATTVLFGRNTMPAFRNSMNDTDLALVLSYVRNAWGNQQGGLIADTDVAAMRSAGK